MLTTHSAQYTLTPLKEEGNNPQEIWRGKKTTNMILSNTTLGGLISLCLQGDSSD